ncbi:Uncharacterised protein [Bordetella pertussis]|nr:Uncharacterised protein [Bordetella pertussis]
MQILQKSCYSFGLGSCRNLRVNPDADRRGCWGFEKCQVRGAGLEEGGESGAEQARPT